MSNHKIPRLVTGTSSGVGRATGFELASRGRPNAANIESALERNRAFAAAGGHEGAVVFPNLRLFVITCLDPRVDPAHFLGLGLSDAMGLLHVLGGSRGDGTGVELANDEVDHRDEVAVGAVPAGAAFRGLDQRVEALEQPV